MTRPIGFSSGALHPTNPGRAIRESLELGATAIELSALRIHELDLVAEAVDAGGLDAFRWVSLHAPSRFDPQQERQIVDRLRHISGDKLPVVLHPDTIHDPAVWRVLGDRLVLENMDRRKATGRFAADFQGLFEKLPEARLCLDVAHVRQVDPAFVEGYRFLSDFRERLVEVHISEVDARSRHDRLSMHAQFNLRDFLTLLPDAVPVIIESRLDRTTAAAELEVVRDLFAPVRAG